MKHYQYVMDAGGQQQMSTPLTTQVVIWSIAHHLLTSSLLGKNQVTESIQYRDVSDRTIEAQARHHIVSLREQTEATNKHYP